MFNFNKNNDAIFTWLTNLLKFWEEKLNDLVDAWYERLLWDVEEDLVSYINSPSFGFTAVLFLLIPISELLNNGIIYYLYIAIMALIFDLILFYILVEATDLYKIPGFAALALRITSVWFYVFALFNPEIFDFIVVTVFPGSGDFVLSEELFLGELDPECGLMDDKKEIMFRIFWGLGHLTMLYIFISAFKSSWRRGMALRAVPSSELPAEELTLDRIYKKSLAAGFVGIFNAFEKYPVCWILPIFLFFAMADFTNFAETPLLLYNALAISDTFRFLSYDFALFETLAWWWLFCGVLVYFGDFGSFSEFYKSFRGWLGKPLSDSNIYKIIFVGFFLVVAPAFWIITDNESFNDYLAIFFLENSVAVYEFGKIAAINYLTIALYYLFKEDGEEGYVLSIFFTTCSIAIFFLGLCLDYHNNLLEGNDHNLFTCLNLFEYYGLGSHELVLFGYDYIALSLCFMTCCVFTLVMYFSVYAEIRYKSYYFSCLFYLFICILITLLSLNLFTFYAAFEATIIPIAVMINQWGSSEKRYFAARQYLLYSIVSGLPLLAGLGHIYTLFGSLDYINFLNNLFMLSYEEQLYLWFAFFFIFAVKIPLFPFHSWLLNAHVEASTGVSIILAAVLLKIGTFGVIRYLLGLFHNISVEMADYIIFFALFGVIYASLCAITEVDLKRLIAYTSIAHMNLAVIGLFMFDESAFYGAVITMLAHSVISTALFFIVGVLYSRIHIREITIYGGMAQLMPILSSFLFFFAIANAGFPCSISFIGEVFLLMAIFKNFGLSFSILVFCSCVLLLYANLRLFMYVCFGTINDNYISPAISDFGHVELAVSLILFLNAFLMFIKFDHYFYPLFFDYLTRYFA
jgi:NADH-quinone oxidoreductase subunit M